MLTSCSPADNPPQTLKVPDDALYIVYLSPHALAAAAAALPKPKGIGRMLLAAMEGWMREHGLSEVWVLADNPGAVGFYQACGFNTYAGQSVYMTRTLE